jgi:hypothetical protein
VSEVSNNLSMAAGQDSGFSVTLGGLKRALEPVNARLRLACSGACSHSTSASNTSTTASGVRLCSSRNSAAARLRIVSSRSWL